jgi:ABC-type transport system involved in multi-copper enzyme maturation permease subunit
MDSTASTSTLAQRLLPSLAILKYEARTLLSSWLVRLWIGASAMLTLVFLLSGWEQMQSPALVAVILFPYLVFPWFLVVMVLGVEPVSGARVEALADGILSRPITRHEYLLGSWGARVLVVLGSYLAVVLPAVVIVGLAERDVSGEGVTLYGAAAALVVVAIVLTLQVSLAFLAGTLLRRPLLAMMVLVFLWYPVSSVLHTFSLEEFSPISLNQSLPTLLRTPWDESQEETAVADVDFEQLSQEAAQFLASFGGGPPAPRRGSFYEQGDYDDFSLLRVVLGYGVPALMALGLTMAVFCNRDL